MAALAAALQSPGSKCRTLAKISQPADKLRASILSRPARLPPSSQQGLRNQRVIRSSRAVPKISASGKSTGAQQGGDQTEAPGHPGDGYCENGTGGPTSVEEALKTAGNNAEGGNKESVDSAEQIGTASKPKSIEDGALLALKPSEESGGSSSGGKWTTISGKASAKHLIMEPLASVSGLGQYLALPVEEYSLLDPTWIEKQEGNDMFHFRIPLAEMGLAMRLEPQTWVKVDIDQKKEQVRFSSSRFLIGDAELDAVLEERLQFEFEATMGYKPVKKYRKAADMKEKDDRVTRVLQIREAGGAIVEAEIQADPTKLEGNNAGEAMPPSAGASGSDWASDQDTKPNADAKDFLPETAVQVSGLNLDVHVKVQVKLPQKSVVGSGLVLKGMGKLVLKAALQALAPAFVRLVSEDYKQWVAKEGKGEREVTEGALIVAKPAHATAAAVIDVPVTSAEGPDGAAGSSEAGNTPHEKQ